jgi:hypothetical protein
VRFLEKNSRIYVREGSDLWSVKGRFDRAVSSEDYVDWQERNGNLMLVLCAVCFHSHPVI